jgi:undecaprenyl-diphosphatase
MGIIDTIILGIVEGLTEFLPISSTGHMIITSKLLALPQSEFLKTFEIAIQSGALVAVIVWYLDKILKTKNLIKEVLIAFIPTAIIGFIFYEIVRGFLGNINIVAISLILGGIIILAVEKYVSKKDLKEEKISNKNAFIIGLAQAIALIPGVSRSGATIVSGLLLGVSREKIVEFSFLLSIPTLGGATFLSMVKTSASFSGYEWSLLLIGFFSACLTALLSIKWFLNFISNRNFNLFGWYRIGLGVIILLLI